VTIQIISRETELERLRTGTHTWRIPLPSFGGELSGDVEVKIENGRAHTFELPRPLAEYIRPVPNGTAVAGELIATPTNLREFIPKFIVDLQVSLAVQPVLYQPIYRTISDSSMPRNVDVSSMMGNTGVVFLERGEGEEIHFGERMRGQYAPVPLRNFAAGFEWTEEVVKWDETWRYQDMVDAIGRSHSALLNRIHLRPILDYAYAAGNITDPAYDPAGDPWINMWQGLAMALQQAALDKNPDTQAGRHPTVILTHSSNRFILEQVLGGLNIMGRPPLPGLGQLNQMVVYDDYTIHEGERAYTFEGADPAWVWLIEPKQYFIELVNQPLQVEDGPGDFSRYVAAQLRASTWRGVVASPAAAVQKLKMPTMTGLLSQRAPQAA
jgi:hypothetical protein